MKVLYFHQYFTTPAGCDGSRSYAFAQSLVQAGHQVQMVCLRYERSCSGLSGPFLNGKRIGQVDGIEVVEFDLPLSNHTNFLTRSIVFFRFSWQSLILSMLSEADIVFATTTPLTAGIPGIATRWLRGLPFVFEVRDLWPELPRAMGVVRNPLVLAALSALEWLSYHSADACIGLAPGICEGIAQRGIEPSRITSIPNACDLELFHPLPQGEVKKPQLVEGLAQSLSQSSFVAAFTGAHGLANGLDAVIDAAAELQDRGRHDIQILLIGDGRCKPSLQRRVESEGLTNCHFLPPIPKLQLAKILQKSVHVGLMILDDVPAFYRGTSPNKFFDYLASGIPVINNYPGWLAELICNYGVGIPVSPRDPEAFAEALIRLADQPALVTSMGANARTLAESNFSRRLLANQWLQLLEATASRYALRRHSYLRKQFYALFKGLVDRVAALAALLLLSPLLVVVALLVHWRMGSPVLFRQKRPGYLCKPFWLVKFRTMTNARDSSGTFLPDSQRLTPFGRLLRITSIDELPSLINVVRGEMSFVGPRPFMIPVKDYEEKFMPRFTRRPGLTGWAQVNGRNSISWSKKFELDCFYVQNACFVLDVYILIKTFFVLLDRRSVSAEGHVTAPAYKKD